MTDENVGRQAARERLRSDNARLRERFCDWLRSRGLSRRTIERHVGNAGVYLDEFLLYDDPVEASEGARSHHLRMFFDYWFVRKCVCASPTGMRAMAASLKKFYAFMDEVGEVTPQDSQEVRATVGLCLPDWLETLRIYFDEAEEAWAI